MPATFDEWTKGRAIASWGTNSGSAVLPFQKWKHFKEAFAPELVARAIYENPISVRRCLDPFGGSGTTAIACQFLGIHPITVEVNPFLADLIEAKLSNYDADSLTLDLRGILRRVGKGAKSIESLLEDLPPTFVEPGVKGRWIFDRSVAARLMSLRKAIEAIQNEQHRKLFRVLLGGILIDVSNVVISGKGRRYRKGWGQRRLEPAVVDRLFYISASTAIAEIHRFRTRLCGTFEVNRGDCRKVLKHQFPCELSVFSPPYPNSFDYTDVYNIDLWMLGYLTDKDSNHTLRSSTLSSHVQISRVFLPPPTGSVSLHRALEQLEEVRSQLWNSSIPEMIGGYFAEIIEILCSIKESLENRGQVWMVVGDSRYAHKRIATGRIISELAVSNGWIVEKVEPFRSMRVSPQQGGHPELAESLVVLSKNEP